MFREGSWKTHCVRQVLLILEIRIVQVLSTMDAPQGVILE